MHEYGGMGEDAHIPLCTCGDQRTGSGNCLYPTIGGQGLNSVVRMALGAFTTATSCWSSFGLFVFVFNAQAGLKLMPMFLPQPPEALLEQSLSPWSFLLFLAGGMI